MEMVDWIGESIENTFWQQVNKQCESILEYISKMLSQTILQPTVPDKYITNFYEYLKGVQFFAAGLLVIFVVLAVFRQISGVMYSSEKSVGTYFIHVTFAGALIYILPKTVTIIFIPINNALIGFIGSVGFGEGELENTFRSAFAESIGVFIFMFAFFVLLIGICILSIAAAIRYIETLIIILVAPLVAISVINNSDGLQIWFREVIAVVFTQTIHYFILQILISIMLSVDSIILMILLSIGCIAVGLKGPQVLRQYLYRTGTSSAVVSTAGSAGRLGMMSMMFKR